MYTNYEFKTKFSRRFPDPVFNKTHNSEKHIFLMKCQDLPLNIGNDPNARTPNTNKSIYKKIKESLLADDSSNSMENGFFHLKNKGITIVAESVEQKGDNIYEVKMLENHHGILDGGHTYKLITDNVDEISENQYVQVEIRTGIPHDWITSMAEGLNTSIQVSQESLFNLEGQFEWLKSILKSNKLINESIAWQENDDGYIHARELLCILTLFNVAIFPNKENKHPIAAYNTPNQILNLYQQNKKSYEAMSDIVLNILYLYDHIRASARDIWNEGKRVSGKKGSAKSLEIIETRKRGNYSFPFSADKETNFRLHKPATYPILSAFRRFVKRSEIKDNFKICWDTDFENIKAFWHKHGYDLLQSVYDTSQGLNYQLLSVGKNNNLWTTLHSQVGIKKLEDIE